MLDRVRIILVSPSGPANVGAVCRAMANLGLSDLWVVAPRCDLRDEAAEAYATRGKGILTAARVVDAIPQALTGCVKSFATSSKLGLYRRQAAITPREAAAAAMRLAPSGAVAIAFGREDYGFKTDELLHFDQLITIPCDGQYPVMNLATAAAIVGYEVRTAWLEAAQAPALPMALNRDVAAEERKQILFAQLFDALDRLGFFYGQKPEHLRHALRHLFGRAELSRNEVDILIGLARQIQWYIDHHPVRIDPPKKLRGAGAGREPAEQDPAGHEPRRRLPPESRPPGD